MNPRLIESAYALHTKGRLDEAESAYRMILAEPAAAGDHPYALEGLGVLLFSQGRVDEAAEYFARRTQVPPPQALAHANLGEALRALGRRDQAAVELKRALELDPKLPQTWNSLALLAQDLGRYQDAESHSRAALSHNPRFAAAYINLANALRSQERRAEAVGALRSALKLEPTNGLAMCNLGQILADVGDMAYMAEAESFCRRALAIMPRLPQAHISLGSVLRVRSRHSEAAACFSRALELSTSGSAGASFAGKDSSPAVVTRAVEPSSSDTLADAYHGLGLAQLEIGRLDMARPAFEQALALDPGRAITWAALSRLQAEEGEFELSNESARRALQARPNMPEALWRLALNLKGRLPDHEYEVLRSNALSTDSPGLPVGHRAFLEFGMAAVLDARGEYALAAEHLERANRMQGQSKAELGLTYDAPQHGRFITQVEAAFTPEFLEARRGWGDPDPRPIFVVGLPRSGTTLTEQIMASHPRVFGAGELDLAHRVFFAIPELVGEPETDHFQALLKLTPETARIAAKNYLSRLDQVAPKADRVVDKMPDNFRLLGLIAFLWPQAKVVVCHRDLRDIALSCWQTGFERNPWTNNWEHIAGRFSDYRRMMTYWRKTRPIHYLDLSYESLVADIEPQSRRLLDFVGLDWDPACLDFHQTKRVVRTASLVQVREQVHTRSVGRWKRYEHAIEPLMVLLDQRGIKPEPEI